MHEPPRMMAIATNARLAPRRKTFRIRLAISRHQPDLQSIAMGQHFRRDRWVIMIRLALASFDARHSTTNLEVSIGWGTLQYYSRICFRVHATSILLFGPRSTILRLVSLDGSLCIHLQVYIRWCTRQKRCSGKTSREILRGVSQRCVLGAGLWAHVNRWGTHQYYFRICFS